MAAETPQAPRQRRRTPFRAWAGAALFAALVAGASAAAVVGLHARAADDETQDNRAPVAVPARPLAVQESYTRAESFAGRIEPRRETELAFERAGLVMEVMAEEGEVVAAGAVLARLDQEPLRIEKRRLEAERTSLKADLALAKATTERRARLRDRGFETGQSFDEARFEVDAVEARIDTLDARLEAIALDLRKSELTAPFAGEIAQRAVDEGRVVQAGSPLLSLQETGRPQARIGLPPERAEALSAGDAIGVAVDEREIIGTIAAVAPDLDPGTRTVSVLIDLPDGPRITMGEVVRLRLDLEIDAAGAWVPLTAFSEAERGLWSILIAASQGDGTRHVAREVVEVIHVAEGRAFVRGSFEDGALLITSGVHRLSLGQPVEIAETAGAEG